MKSVNPKFIQTISYWIITKKILFILSTHKRGRTELMNNLNQNSTYSFKTYHRVTSTYIAQQHDYDTFPCMIKNWHESAVKKDIHNKLKVGTIGALETSQHIFGFYKCHFTRNGLHNQYISYKIKKMYDSLK